MPRGRAPRARLARAEAAQLRAQAVRRLPSVEVGRPERRTHPWLVSFCGGAVDAAFPAAGDG